MHRKYNTSPPIKFSGPHTHVGNKRANVAIASARREYKVVAVSCFKEVDFKLELFCFYFGQDIKKYEVNFWQTITK